MPKMGFFGRLRDVVSGRIARSNVLIGNHGVRICDKVKNDVSSVGVFVRVSAYCATHFLVRLLFDDNATIDNLGEEPNPFKEHVGRLDGGNSYEMFKLVAANFLVRFLAEGDSVDENLLSFFQSLREDMAELVRSAKSDIRDQFFDIYEFSDDDKEIFYDLVRGQQKGNASEGTLYEYIFRRAYRITPPHYPAQMVYFIGTFDVMFREMFLPGLTEGLRSLNEK